MQQISFKDEVTRHSWKPIVLTCFRLLTFDAKIVQRTILFHYEVTLPVRIFLEYVTVLCEVL